MGVYWQRIIKTDPMRESAMSKQREYLISYILNNQPQSITLQADAESLTPEQALAYLQREHGPEASAAISDVQVSHIDKDKLADAPSHRLQS